MKTKILLFTLSIAGFGTHHQVLAQLTFSVTSFNPTGLEIIFTEGDSLSGPSPSSNSPTLRLFGFKNGNLVSNWVSETSSSVGAFVIDNGSRSATANSVSLVTHFGFENLMIGFSTSDSSTSLPSGGTLSGTLAQRTLSFTGSIDTSAIDELQLRWGTGSTSGTAADGTFQSAAAVPEPSHFSLIGAALAIGLAIRRRRPKFN